MLSSRYLLLSSFRLRWNLSSVLFSYSLVSKVYLHGNEALFTGEVTCHF